jgi:HNH endonuclease/AP2 domain
MRYILTGQKRSDAKRQLRILVDDEDYEFLNQFAWQVDKENSVAMHFNGKTMLLHRFIINPPKGLEIDHIDGNRLNNQKSNLRLATSSQNKINRGPRKDNKSGYKGVSWHKQQEKWTARIMTSGKYLSLGLFKDIRLAAQAYNEAAVRYYGAYAWLNTI